MLINSNPKLHLLTARARWPSQQSATSKRHTGQEVYVILGVFFVCRAQYKVIGNSIHCDMRPVKILLGGWLILRFPRKWSNRSCCVVVNFVDARYKVIIQVTTTIMRRTMMYYHYPNRDEE